jgi:hypothetical protein
MTTASASAVPAPGLGVPVARDNVVVRAAALIVLVDLLFLPYFPWFVAPMSLAIVIPWALCRLEIRPDRDLKRFFFIAVLVSLSAGLSIVYRDLPLVVENIKRAGQFLTTFAYYFFFRRVARDQRFRFECVLLLFLVFYSAWAIYFMVTPTAASARLQSVYPSVAFVPESDFDLSARFTYMFADPNTAGYLIGTVTLFLLGMGRLSALGTAAVLSMLMLGTIVSGSRGVMLAVALALVGWAWRRGIIGRYLFRFAIAAALLVLVIAGAFRYYGARNPDQTYRVSILYDALLARMTGKGEQSVREVLIEGETSAGASRLRSYRHAVQNLWPLPLGRGYELFGGPASFRPHSDVLRILYGYGFFALFSVMMFFFRDLARFEFAFVAFMAFAINSLIDEQKLLAVFFALLAIARVEMARRNMLEQQRR